MPWKGKPGDADYRRWGPGYWWQNTRLPYHAMIAAGDYDMMKPLFHMYVDQLLPFLRYRTKLYLHHDGVFIPECIYFWGDVFTETYGWHTPFAKRTDRLQESRWHKWDWVSGPGLAGLMFDYYDHTQDADFLREKLLPFADDVLTFFDQQYKTGPDGKLIMHPAQSIETWWDATDPMPEIAGLHMLTNRLLALPDDVGDAKQRAFWKKVRDELPPLPVREVNGVKMLAPAAKFSSKHNSENPELYAVFPFKLIAVGKPNLDLGIEALKHRTDRGHAGWRQDGIFMAYLGLADDARRNLVARASQSNRESLFPAFWGPNYDWTPDQDHGSNLMTLTQAMAMQCEGRKIYLLPAWPRQWNVHFKLHAPDRTTVECDYRDGKVISLHVEPAARAVDVIRPADMR